MGNDGMTPSVLGTVEPATRDETHSAQFPLLFCQLRLSGLHLITRMTPDPPPAREGVRRRYVSLKEGRPALAAGVLDLPLEGSGTSVCLPDLLVRAPVLRSGGTGIAT